MKTINLIATTLPLLITGVALAEDKPISFEKQLLPLFEEKCFSCHGGNEKGEKPEGGLDLTSIATMKAYTEGDMPLFMEGDAFGSSLFFRVELPPEDEDVMPPADSKKKGLTQEQMDLVQHWIDQGAKFGTWTQWEKGAKKKGKQ